MESPANHSDAGAGLSGRTIWLCLAALVAAGIALRCGNFYEVFRPDGVVFPGHDPYYHMRRILMILESYPQTPIVDALINHPFGAVVIWTPLFDLFVATVIRLAGFGAENVRGAEIVACWVVPVIGAATVLPLYRMGRRVGGNGAGLLAAALLVLSPAHIWYSRLGFVDHHAAVTLIQVVMFLVCMRACQRHPGRPSRLAAAGLVVCIVAGLLTWTGFLLFVVILDLFLLMRWVLARDPHMPRLIWIVHLPAAVLLLPSAARFVGSTGEPFTAITLSYFHVAAVAGFGWLGAAVDAYRSPRWQALSRPLRLALPVGLVVVTLGFLARTSALAEGLDWLLARDAFMAQVNESRPLLAFSRRGVSTRLEMPGMVTVLFPAAALAWAWLAFRSRSCWRGTDAPRQLFLVWSGALLLAAAGQRRFLESFAPAEALLVALGLIAAVRAGRRLWVLLGAGLLLVVALAPWHAGALAGRDRLLAKGGDVWFNRAISGFRAKLSAPPPAPPRGEAPPFGALGPWYLGHRILYLTGLPVVTNNFGSHIGADSYRDGGAFFLARDESEAVEMLERRKVRYVFVDHDLDFAQAAIEALGRSVDDYFVVRHDGDADVFTPLEPYLETMAFRMAHLRGLERSFVDRNGSLFIVPALDRFRIVHEHPRRGPKASLKVYELVQGARLQIAGIPGERVEIVYQSALEPPLPYTKRPVVGEDGWARTTVPYPSDRPELALGGSYLVRSGAATTELRVPDAAVQDGRVITVRLVD